MRKWHDKSLIQSIIRHGISLLLLFCFAANCLANGYGIITTSDIRSASSMLTTFEAHKQSRGFNVQVFDETDWSGSGLTGDSAAEALRGFLQSAHIQHNLKLTT